MIARVNKHNVDYGDKTSKLMKFMNPPPIETANKQLVKETNNIENKNANALDANAAEEHMNEEV